MDKGRFLIETHLRTGRSIKELAAAHGVSESWLFKLLRRYRIEGPAGLEPRSRRPKTSPMRIADLYEDEIVRWHKELADQGFDAGAETIHFHMSTPGREVPSVSTIQRVLVARGFVTPNPKKRPKCALHPLRRRVPQRVLAGRRHPRRSGRRRRLRGPQHDRRPLEAVCGQPGLRHHPLARRGAHPAQSGRDAGAIRGAS